MDCFAMVLLLIAQSAAVGALPISTLLSTGQDANLFPSFVSYSIELEAFPLFAGNTSNPNHYSINLLENIGAAQGGGMPTIRVGGNSQDWAIYDPSLTTATASSCNADPGAVLCIGDSFFDSYGTFPNTKYSHGFNLAANNISGYNTLTATVPLACRSLSDGKLDVWEFGNEPDRYIPDTRPSNWTTEDYIAEWLNGTDRIRVLVEESCPHLASGFGFMAPSFSNKFVDLQPLSTFNQSLDQEDNVYQVSMHNYIASATSQGVTLQSTLMNHTVTADSINAHVKIAQELATYSTNYILGELNSLSGGGAVGLSNVFGAALWNLDVIAYAASTGAIKRMHFHQADGSPYSAWVPLTNSAGDVGTRAPYYGELAAATFLGDSSKVVVQELSLSSNETGVESAYAAYVQGDLVRLAILNMREYNSTAKEPRSSQNYSFKVDRGTSWTIKTLAAPGSNVTTGVTFNGYAYEYNTLGTGVKVDGRATDQRVRADSNGTLSITVQDSEAIIAIKA